MDEHDIEEHSDEEPQEPMIESTEAPQIVRDDFARDVVSASEAEAQGLDASETVEESSPVAPEADAAPSPEMQEEPVVQTETEHASKGSGSRSGSQSFSGSRGAQFASRRNPS